MQDILIIGAGSIGALMGAALIQGGLKITFAGKPNSNYTKNIQKQGLQIYYPQHKKLWISPLHPGVRFVDTATDLNQKFDIIIVALKSNHLIDVIDYIQAHAKPQTILIHAQNGIPYWWFNCDRYCQSLNQKIVKHFACQPYLNAVDPQGILNQTLGKYKLVGCVVKAPCQKNQMGKIRVRKTPQLIFGLTTQEEGNYQQQSIIKYLCNLFIQQGIKARYTPKIRTVVCHKLAINLTTNVLAALTGKAIADLTKNTATNNLIKTIIAEVNRVFSHYAIAPADLPTEEKIYSYIQTPGSQSHLPSLAQDLAQHKQGEINLITAPVEMAEIAQLKVPTLYSLSQLLQLAQTYTLNHQGQANILTLDRDSGCCILNKNIHTSNSIDRYQISTLLDRLITINYGQKS